MSTLSDPQPRLHAGASKTWGKGNSKMSREERSRADAFWRARLDRAERVARFYPREEE